MVKLARRLPVPDRTSIVARVEIPESSRIQVSASATTSGTSAGNTRSVTRCPSDLAKAYPAPSEPVRGSAIPPVASTSSPACKGSLRSSLGVISKPSDRRLTDFTRQGFLIRTPRRAHSSSSAERTVWAESVTGNILPVASCLSPTPRSAKKAIVSRLGNALSTFLIALRDDPA